ncbi:MAG: transglutaminase family protein [Limisphaerales bacterium]
MSPPRWILAVGLMFWGISVGMWPLAIPAVLLLIAPGFAGRRFDVSSSEFARALDVCWLLVFGGLLLVYSREPVGSVLRGFIPWLPLVTFPAILVQAWSVSERVPKAALLPVPWWRRRDHGESVVDLSGPYLVFCLLSASVAGGGRSWFFPGLAAVAGLALWRTRACGFGALPVSAFLVAAILGGWVVSLGLSGLQGWFENRFLAWVTQWRRDEAAFRSARTAIGSTGWVGGSGQVILTVRSDGGGRVPPRLRLAVFTAWSEGTWYASSGGFEKVEGSGGEWVLDGAQGRDGLTGSARIEMNTHPTGGLLAIPGGARAIGDCPADSLERTPLGAVRGTHAGGMLPYRADFGEDAGWELAPGEGEGYEIRAMERPAIEAVAEELKLAGRPADEVVGRVGEFFASRFRYTTDLKPSTSKDPRATTALGRFLLSDREGHCEYFATAGVLLLRSAGIPARYVTGFLVNPLEQVNGVHRVRAKDAHAWVRYWSDGKWRDFDPTPPALFDAPPTVSRWSRFWNDLAYSIRRWWWLGEKRWLREAYWLVVPLLVLAVWRFRQVRAVRQAKSVTAREAGVDGWPGRDSEWFDVEAKLARRGWSRGVREGWSAWMDRLEKDADVRTLGERIRRAHPLHERLRFDPVGLTPSERSELRRVAGELSVELGGPGVRVSVSVSVSPRGDATRS